MRYFIFLIQAFILIGTTSLSAHCQLPCGIYHDDLEFALLDEAIQTLHKANDEIINRNSSIPVEMNQRVRAVNLKDEYANKINYIMTFYFLEQRIKPEQAHWTELLKSCHRILVDSMKVKQTVDQDLVGQLQQEIDEFKTLYQQNNS